MKAIARQAALAVAISGSLLLLAGPALAHTAGSTTAGFGAGFLHPLTGFDHLLAMVSVGLWGAVLGRPLIYVLPVVFPAMMVVGAIAGMVGLAVPPSETAVALSVLVLGACIALSVTAPVWA